jgi:hypothetical protein
MVHSPWRNSPIRLAYRTDFWELDREKAEDLQDRRRPRAVATPRGIVCSPPPRHRLSVSTRAAKVLASLLKARSALSCCGILTAVKFSILPKQKTDPPQILKNFKTGNAHLYRLGANAEPGNGSIDDMGRGTTSFVFCLFVV